MTNYLVENVAYADDLIREYLVFRGFGQTLKSFNLEKRHDKTKGFQAAKIVETLLLHANSFNLSHMLELWACLNETFFTKVPETKDLLMITYRLELSLKRYYVINCINKGNMEKLKEFFQTCGDELAGNDDWTIWFSLPYMKNPQNHPYFKEFFSKSWVEMFSLSLTNFLATTFQNVPLPKVLNFNAERSHRKILEEEIARLQQELNRVKMDKKKLKQQLKNYDPNIQINHTSSNNSMQQSPVPKSPRSRTLDQDESTHLTRERSSTGSLVSRTGSLEELPKYPFLETPMETYTGHNSAITKCKFSPSGQDIATASVDGTVKVWSVSSSKRQATLFCFTEVTALTWETKGNKMLFCGTADARVKVWNTAAEKIVAELKIEADTPRVLDIVASPSGPNFVTSSTTPAHNKACLLSWNMKTLQVENKLPVDPDMIAINCVTFNHNGSMIAAGGSDGMIRIYDMSSCSPIMGWNAHAGEVLSVQFSYDETSVFSLGSDGKIGQWSIHRIGEAVRSFEYEGFLNSTSRNVDMAFDIHGEYFLVGSKYPRGLIYKVDAPRAVQMVNKGHSAAVVAVDWTQTQANETLCATGSLDHTVRIAKLGKVSFG